MDRLLVVVFDSESQAEEGVKALEQLHSEGSITLYGDIVIAKDERGKAVVKRETDSTDRSWVWSAVGVTTFGQNGVPGEPAGVLVVAEFLDQVKSQLEPGRVAVVAEVAEDEVTPVDSRAEALGGKVYRRDEGELLHAQIEQDLGTLKTQRDAYEAARANAGGEQKAKLEARAQSARAALEKEHERASARLEATQREAEAKAAAVKVQFGQASAERKQELEKRLAEVQADHKARMAKLQQALEQTRETLGSTGPDARQAIDPKVMAGRPPIERVSEKMTVVDSDRKEIGRVTMVQLGDAEAASVDGEDVELRIQNLGVYREPTVPRALRASLVRMGFIKVERSGPRGIGEKNHYVRADWIADVSGDRVTLTVPEAKLPAERE